MSNTKKLIKYLAISLAIFLIVNIFSGIIYGVDIVINLFEKEEVEKIENYDTYQDINTLKIDIKTSNLVIKKGNSFKIATNNKEINYTKDGNSFIVDEKDYNFLKNNKETDLIIYVPDSIFNEASIKTGAGKVSIEHLRVNELNLNLGAGKIEIDYIESIKETSIETGLGEVNIKSSKINNLDFDMGIGKVIMFANITGNSKINSGIGSLTLNLLNEFDNYQIEVNKGIGEVLINNKSIKDKEIVGSGSNKIELNKGIGKVLVSFN